MIIVVVESNNFIERLTTMNINLKTNPINSTVLSGLTKEHWREMFLSGILIGMGMFVRFSNLTQLIVIILIPMFYIIMWIGSVLNREKGKRIWLKDMLRRMVVFLVGYT